MPHMTLVFEVTVVADVGENVDLERLIGAEIASNLKSLNWSLLELTLDVETVTVRPVSPQKESGHEG